jgi:hypothetical protein
MNPVQIDPRLLPTQQELARATLAAGAVAALLLVVAVLPAEAGIDPTGLGRRMGLTALAEAGRSAPVSTRPKVPEPAAEPDAPLTYSFRSDELQLTLKPAEGAEIKATMRGGDQMMYAWTADKGELYFDLHGEPKGAPPDVFTSFETGTTGAAEGDFEAPYEGIHGWYWENRGTEVVTVTLKTSGVYAKIARKM